VLGARSNESVELPQAIRDGIREMQERWNNRFDSEAFNIAEEYLNGRIGFLIQMNGPPNSEVKPGAAIGTHAEGAIFHLDNRAIYGYSFEPRNTCGSGERSQDCMLVGIVKEMQRIEYRASSCFVCPETNKEILRVFARRFYSVTRGFIIPLVVPRRKGQVSILCTAVQSDQFPSRVIEGGSEVVHRIPNNERNCFRNWVAKMYLDCDITVRIAANAKCVGVALDECCKNDIKITDVMLGPI
jgi:hypothetical protein